MCKHDIVTVKVTITLVIKPYDTTIRLLLACVLHI